MKNKRPLQTAAVLGALMVLILCFQSRQAYGYAVSKTNGGAEIYWSTSSAGFYINTSGFPSGSLQAIQAAIKTWTDVSTSNFSFIYRGGLTATAYGENDGINLICFGSFGAGYESTLAVNTFWYTASGQLLDSDIKFNENFDLGIGRVDKWLMTFRASGFMNWGMHSHWRTSMTQARHPWQCTIASARDR